MKKRFGKQDYKKGGARKGPRNGKTFGKQLVKKSPNAKWKQEDVRRKITISETFKKKTSAQRLVESLQNKKDRDAKKLFLVEGEKTFLETIQSDYRVHSIFATHAFLATYPEIVEYAKDAIHVVDAEELSQMGTLANNMMVIGVFHQKILQPLVIGNELVIAISDVNDPGNLGTLIRIADWYGIRKIIASKNTVDMYNPKVISATKGSFTRVDVYSADLESLFAEQDIAIIAADLEGSSVHKTSFPSRGVLLLGSEAHGIPHDLDDFITGRVTIPRYGDAESLNVAVAGAIILDNWKKSL